MATYSVTTTAPIDVDQAREWCQELLQLEDEDITSYLYHYPLHTRTSILELIEPRQVITIDPDKLFPITLAFGSVYTEAIALIVDEDVSVSLVKNQLYTVSIAYSTAKANVDVDAFLAFHYGITITDGFATKGDTETKPLPRVLQRFYVDLAQWYCLCPHWHRQIKTSDNPYPVSTPWGQTKIFKSMPTCRHLVAVFIVSNNTSVYYESREAHTA